MPSTLDITSKFYNHPTLEEHAKVDKGAMFPLRQLIFDVLHTMILLRKQNCTEANFLDLTLVEFLYI